MSVATVGLLVISIATAVRADVRLPHVFSDHMVLQRDINIPVWGWDNAGQKVTVTLGESKAETVTGKDGKWSLKLAAMKAGGPHKMTVTGSSTAMLGNVMTGDVWIASGQSNMHMTTARVAACRYGGVNQTRVEVARADKYPNVRLFLAPKQGTQTPKDDCEGGWTVCRSGTVRNFSGVGYLFSRYLHDAVKVPIGVIDVSVGGSVAEAWISREVVEGNSAAKAGPKKGMSVYYNAMLAPLIPYGIKGAIWYQGEGNVSRHAQYRDVMALLIGDWRKRWGVGEFPFIFVQLANFYKESDGPWPELREAQLRTWQTVPNTAMAVAADTGGGGVHPRNKQDVALRLCLAARAIAYGEKIVYSGPIYREMKIEGGRVRLLFDHVGGGLVAKRGDLKYFEVAGKDGKYHPATATIDGKTILVGREKTPNPVAARYAWRVNPLHCNLYNKENIAASPFRTDDPPRPAPDKSEGK
jgi:sialate O-acetylesterase